LRIKYYNRRQLPQADETKYNATYCSSLHELLSSSDIVSINCPLNAKTTNLISTSEFAAMKEGAFFINTARGAIVDEAALKEALGSGKIARAGLDVLCNEPNVDPWFFEQDNVVLQPHLGGLTDIAFQKAERECFENVRSFFQKGKANSPVNADQVAK
jgi:lactate dehydrogenase-like 2-hydroxyacid dehydrogenase